MITHYDLFAGIGGFSLALYEVFKDETIKHIFCEWEQFPTAVLKRHWPAGEYWGDIADLVANTPSERRQPGRVITGASHKKIRDEGKHQDERFNFSIVTGGFPCQPFSHAGRRKGTADDRYQWPNMFAVIRGVKPEWVIAENVRGLATWNDGMVLEQVCSDLEGEGYEVQPLIIPACAVGAPHRRDRVWIIAQYAGESSDTNSWQGRSISVDQPIQAQKLERGSDHRASKQYPDWNRNWQEVAFATCNDAMDDGLPRELDGTQYTFAKWRKESLKAYGNAIVPEVAMRIFEAIRKG